MTRIRNPTGKEAVEALLASRTATGVVPGLSAAVVEGDRLVWAKGFGVADLASTSPATPRTSYLWFSMTKIVTATATVKLAEEGELDLDAPVTDYFPDFSLVSGPCLRGAPRWGAGFWNVMRVYPGESLGVVVMGNTSSYDHETICDAVVGASWD